MGLLSNILAISPIGILRVSLTRILGIPPIKIFMAFPIMILGIPPRMWMSPMVMSIFSVFNFVLLLFGLFAVYLNKAHNIKPSD